MGALRSFLKKRILLQKPSVPSVSASGLEIERSPRNSNVAISALASSEWKEEYIRALRTTSYEAFQNKLGELKLEGRIDTNSSDLTPKSLQTVSEGLLEPDQKTVDEMLNQIRSHEKDIDVLELVSDYFDCTAKASRFCGTLLRSIEQAKIGFKIVEDALQYSPACSSHESNEAKYNSMIRWQYIHGHIAQLENPFNYLLLHEFDIIREGYQRLYQRSEKRQKKMANRARLWKAWKISLGVVLSMACISAIVGTIVATHGLLALVVTIAPVMKPLKLSLGKKVLTRQWSQVDAIGRGSFTLTRELDTIMCTVSRLCDEMEHNKALIDFGWRHQTMPSLTQEIVTELAKSHGALWKKLEQLEEHVISCFVTINRARIFLTQEICKLHELRT